MTYEQFNAAQYLLDRRLEAGDGNRLALAGILRRRVGAGDAAGVVMS